MRTSVTMTRWLVLIFGILIILVIIIAAYFLFVAKTKAASEQPIAFNHQAMAQVGINCLFCHTDARISPAEGIPSVEKCMGCHTVIATDKPAIKELAGYWARQESIPWVRVNLLPRFVFFNHQIHIAQGLNCERCHGDVGHMTADRPVLRMNMGWCLDCHEQQPNSEQLRDCIICHR
jgi:hypothetical protein